MGNWNPYARSEICVLSYPLRHSNKVEFKTAMHQHIALKMCDLRAQNVPQHKTNNFHAI